MANQGKGPVVLVVEDDAQVRNWLVEYLQKKMKTANFVQYGAPWDALKAVKGGGVTAVVSDLWFPKEDVRGWAGLADLMLACAETGTGIVTHSKARRIEDLEHEIHETRGVGGRLTVAGKMRFVFNTGALNDKNCRDYFFENLAKELGEVLATKKEQYKVPPKVIKKVLDPVFERQVELEHIKPPSKKGILPVEGALLQLRMKIERAHKEQNLSKQELEALMRAYLRTKELVEKKRGEPISRQFLKRNVNAKRRPTGFLKKPLI